MDRDLILSILFIPSEKLFSHRLNRKRSNP